MKELPRVYANPIDREIDNVQKQCYTSKELVKKDNRNLSMKIKDIFSSRNYVYKSKVIITTSSGKKEETIIGKTSDYLLTIDGTRIRLNDIYDIDLT